ncbi:hypothetical protein CU097_011909, partial [Rhizopus azygosporus]
MGHRWILGGPLMVIDGYLWAIDGPPMGHRWILSGPPMDPWWAIDGHWWIFGGPLMVIDGYL